MTCRCDPARRPKRSNGSNGVKRPFCLWAGGAAPRSNGSNREMLSAEGKLSLNWVNRDPVLRILGGDYAINYASMADETVAASGATTPPAAHGAPP